MTPENLITALMGILIGTYGFIFKSVFGKIEKLEARPIANPTPCISRFEALEKRQNDYEPVLARMEATLSRIEAVIEFLKKDYDNRQR